MHQAYRHWGIADGNDTTPLEVEALMKKRERAKRKGKEKGQRERAKRKGKEKGQRERAKRKGKEKGQRRKGKEKGAKEETSDTSNVKCFFCKEKGHAPKFSAWLAEKKTVGHEQSANSIEEDGWIFALDHEREELCELIMIDSGASVHVCPPDHGQENGTSQIEYETIVDGIRCRNETARNETSEPGCDVHFTKNRCSISKDDGKEHDMIHNGGVFFVAARPSEPTSREANSLELNPVTAAEVGVSGTGKGTRCVWKPGSRCRSNVGRRWRARSAYQGSRGPCDAPSAEERAPHEASGHVPYRSWCQWCIAARAADKPHLRRLQPDTDEAVPRIEFDFADLEREEDQVLPIPFPQCSRCWLRELVSNTLSHESIQ